MYSLQQRKGRLTVSYDDIHALLGLLIVLWLNAGNARFVVENIPMIVKLGLVCFWFLWGICRHRYFLFQFATVAWPMILFVMLVFISKTLGQGDYYRLYANNFLYILILLAVFVYYYFYGKQRQRKLILAAYVIDMAVVSVRTLYELTTNPIVVRAISTGAEQQATLLDEIPVGIGGYGFCYALVFGTILITMLPELLKKHAWVKIAACGVILVLLFEAQITMAFLALIAVIVLSFFVGKKRSAWRILGVGCGVALLVVFFMSYETILDWAIGIADESMAQRLHEIKIFFQTSGEVAGSDMTSRWRLYTQSLDAFLAHPVYGSFGAQEFGCHSSFLDMLGAYGVFGALGIWGILSPYAVMRKYLLPEYRRIAFISLLTISVLAIVNVMHSSEIMVAFLVVIPLSLRYFSEKEQTKGYEGCPN